MEKIIKVHSLAKNFGVFKAVKGIDFDVNEGEFFAFLGPNGAGKSTTISILTTILAPTSGEIKIVEKSLGKNDDEIRHNIGVVFQDSLLDKTLSVRDNLVTRARLYGLDSESAKIRVEKVIGEIQLSDFIDRKYEKLSGGQRRRADIARALIAEPKILFLDEPTTGLDPQSRNLVWETLTHLRQKNNLTIFLTTHYMEEAEKADHVTIIDHGEVIAHGTPAELRKKHSANHLKLRYSERLYRRLNEKNINFKQINDILDISVDSSQARQILIDFGKDISDFEFIQGTMDDVFLSLTGTNVRDDNQEKENYGMNKNVSKNIAKNKHREEN